VQETNATKKELKIKQITFKRDNEKFPSFNFEQLTREPRRISIGILRPHLPLHE
jgi:hypothetical protein